MLTICYTNLHQKLRVGLAHRNWYPSDYSTFVLSHIQVFLFQVFKYSHHQCMEELSHENLNTFSCEMEGRWFRGSRVGPSTRHKLGNIGSAKIFTHEQVCYIGLERLNGTWLELERINLVPFPNKTRVAEGEHWALAPCPGQATGWHSASPFTRSALLPFIPRISMHHFLRDTPN